MKSKHAPKEIRRVLNKLTWFSGVLREVDDWLDLRESSGPFQKTLTFENLDHHISREKGESFG